MPLKHTLAAAIAALTITLSAGAAFAAIGTATGDVNIREEADKTSDSLGILHEGDAAEFDSCHAGWCALADDEGYVSVKYLAFGGYDEDDEDDEEYEDHHDYEDDYDVDVDFGLYLY